ncbi:Transmembrane protein [Spathaspora sp. JA1]|nr:Transmembrane protein [Spathaspora sp. JA1]
MSLLRGHNLAKSSKILLGLLTTVSILVFIFKYQQYRALLESGDDIKFHDINVSLLQLIPRSTIFNPWVLVVAIFAEISVFAFLFSFVVLLISSKFVERFWGYLEVIKFVILVGTITNLITVVVAIVSNIARNDAESMDKPLGGGISYYFGFLVVFKQLIPEHNIVLFQGLINFRVKQVPFAMLVLVGVWSLFISRSLYPAIPSIGSFFVSYFYLRFFQTLFMEPTLPVASTSDSLNSSLVTGDASDTFQLVEFFPVVTKSVLSGVFNSVYNVSALLGLITPFNDESLEQSNLRAQKRQEQVGKSRKSNAASSVAERRRQVALQVIEDRISKETSAPA